MNLAVRIPINIRVHRVLFIAIQVLRTHRNHTESLLVWVDIFDDAVTRSFVVRVRVRSYVATHMRQQVVPFQFPRRNARQHIPRDIQVVRLRVHEKQRPHQPPRVITDSNLRVRVIKHHRCVNINHAALLLQLEFGIQPNRVLRNTHPDAIYKHLHLVKGIARRQRLNPFNIFVDMCVK